jgi:hypothetical protein
MAKTHIAKASEHISKLAVDNGFLDWHTIWKANSSLSAKRKNPNVLYKGNKLDGGDSVTIPKQDATPAAAPTNADHPFVTPNTKLFLRLRILHPDFTAVASAAYELTIDGAAAPLKGNTDAMGQIEQEIPRGAQTADLTVRLPPPKTAPGQPIIGPTPVTWHLQIGALNPIMEQAPDKWCTSGVQQRLNNLGLGSGPIDGISGPLTKAAVKTFQSLCGLKVDGAAGQGETQPKLVDIFDKPDSVLGPLPKPANPSP